MLPCSYKYRYQSVRTRALAPLNPPCRPCFPLRPLRFPLLLPSFPPPDVLVKLEKRDLPWERFYDLSSQELGELIRAPKMGKSLHKLIHQFPR